MPEPCGACGFPAETVVSLPDPWESYLIDQRGFAVPPERSLRVPVCRGCRETIDGFLDPRDPDGGIDPDASVRAFLDRLDEPSPAVES